MGASSLCEDLLLQLVLIDCPLDCQWYFHLYIGAAGGDKDSFVVMTLTHSDIWQPFFSHEAVCLGACRRQT